MRHRIAAYSPISSLPELAPSSSRPNRSLRNPPVNGPSKRILSPCSQYLGIQENVGCHGPIHHTSKKNSRGSIRIHKISAGPDAAPSRMTGETNELHCRSTLKYFRRIREYTKRYVQYEIQRATRRRRSLDADSLVSHVDRCLPSSPPSQSGSLANIGSGRRGKRRRELNKFNILIYHLRRPDNRSPLNPH